MQLCLVDFPRPAEKSTRTLRRIDAWSPASPLEQRRAPLCAKRAARACGRGDNNNFLSRFPRASDVAGPKRGGILSGPMGAACRVVRLFVLPRLMMARRRRRRRYMLIAHREYTHETLETFMVPDE